MKDTRLCRFLPHRGTFGAPRPSELAQLPLPPSPMPSHDGARPLKAWRYVGVFGPELMLCAASVRIGPARQSFWALWDREQRRLYERTSVWRPDVELQAGRIRVLDSEIQLDLGLDEAPGVETICPAGDSYAWTRKQGGVRARGAVAIAGRPRVIDAAAIIDDTAAYYPRRTSWRWCAGVGIATDGRALAWNLVDGVNDPRVDSERTLWIDGQPVEVPPCRFTADLRGVDDLRFHAEAVREREDNLLLVRSRYRQPFGTFSGALPGGIELAAAYGVMEAHDARW